MHDVNDDLIVRLSSPEHLSELDSLLKDSIVVGILLKLLPHDLLITKIHLTLELATRGTSLKLTAWEQRRSVLLDWAENGRGRLSVNPDALFGLKDGEKPEGQNTSYFFLEVVRSRESDYQRQQSYFMRKMEAFLAYHRQGKHTARYGIANFRVITVTPTKQRALNLCQKLQKAGLAFKRFWFTDLAAISSDEPSKILERVFFTPKDFQQGAFYSLEIRTRIVVRALFHRTKSQV